MLDPENTDASIDEPQPIFERIPAHIHKFGYTPSIVHLYPGDLILTSECKTSITSFFIRKYQGQSFQPHLSMWTHAAVHVEGGTLVEATGNSVRLGHVYDYVPSHRLMVRRYKTLSREKRLRIALKACQDIGKSYQYDSLIQFSMSYLSNWAVKKYIGRQYTICSQIYLNAFMYGAKKVLTGVPLDGHVTPAHLAACPDYVEIELKWIKLAAKVQ